MNGTLSREYEKYTLGLVLFDLLPVIFFLFSGILIWKMYGHPLFLTGVIACFIGGLSKVIWKLIIVTGKKDMAIFNKIFRALMPGGFVLMLLAVIISACTRGGSFLAAFWHGLTMMPAVIFFIAGIAGMCLMGYLGSHMDRSARSNWIEEATNAAAQLAILIGVVIVYFGMYYHASNDALTALRSDDNVHVAKVEEGYYFDGSGTDDALVFYPGAKVEAEAYAPLMHLLAEKGVDCYLCRMPLNFALFDRDAAEEIQEKAREGSRYYTGTGNDYSKWYIGGHSLGGAAAAMLAAGDPEDWSGLVLLASYPTDEMSIPVISIYGSEDLVLNRDNYSKAGSDGLWPDDFTELVIQGGNHAQFGNYGKQKGDGDAAIKREDQQLQTAEAVAAWAGEH